MHGAWKQESDVLQQCIISHLPKHILSRFGCLPNCTNLRATSICQILCAHAGAIVFSLATSFEAASAMTSGGTRSPAAVELQGIGSSAATALSSAAVTAHALLQEQRRKLSIRPVQLGDGKRQPARKWKPDSNGTAEANESPCGVAAQSEPGARTSPNRCCRNKADSARILPIHEDPTASDTDQGSSCSMREDEEWTVETVSDLEVQQFPSSV